MTRQTMTRLIGFALLSSTLFLTACNTVSGAGQDIQKGGQAIQNKADQHNNE
jgi:entericidin B